LRAATPLPTSIRPSSSRAKSLIRCR
jgi:hypothetical protein